MRPFDSLHVFSKSLRASYLSVLCPNLPHNKHKVETFLFHLVMPTFYREHFQERFSHINLDIKSCILPFLPSKSILVNLDSLSYTTSNEGGEFIIIVLYWEFIDPYINCYLLYSNIGWTKNRTPLSHNEIMIIYKPHTFQQSCVLIFFAHEHDKIVFLP